MNALKSVKTLAAALIGGLILVAGPGQPIPEARAQQADTGELTVEEIVFVPPGGGAPRDRIGAGTRGSGGGTLLRLMAPASGGVSAISSPRLYWWLSEPYSGEMEIVVRRDGTNQPLLAMTETVSLKDGLNSIDLADMGMRLSATKVYHWSVALKDARVKALNLVEFRKPGSPLGDGSAIARAKQLAAQGYWYDAYALIAETPGMEKARDALHAQVGINLPQ
ncbi:MAG: DUF928 domain-containing protein [Pseudomonadota bacterium]